MISSLWPYCVTYKLMCLFNDGHVDDFTGAVRLGHPVPGDGCTLFCTGWLVLSAISDTTFVDSLASVQSIRWKRVLPDERVKNSTHNILDHGRCGDSEDGRDTSG